MCEVWGKENHSKWLSPSRIPEHQSREYWWLTTAEGGQKLGSRSTLGERQGPWLTQSLTQSLTESLTYSFSTENAGAGAVCCQFMFQTLHATSQDDSSLEFVAATEGRECNIQDAMGRGLWYCPNAFCVLIFGGSSMYLIMHFQRFFWYQSDGKTQDLPIFARLWWQPGHFFSSSFLLQHI